MHIKYPVELSAEEREELMTLTRAGKVSVRKLKRAQVLLMADRRRHTDEQIRAALSMGASTIYRIRKQLVEEGLEATLNEKARPGGARLLDANMEATLVAVACSKPPAGRARWTMQLLADRLVVLTDLDTVSADTVRRRLGEKKIKPWQKKMWCIPAFDANFVAHMEDVLDLYAEEHDPKRPVVCFDEAMKQLVEETRVPIPAAPGRPERIDYEYKRNGTANIFLFLDRLRGWRHAKPTSTKGNADFAECMRDLVDVHYPDADVIRVVMDNLGTHRPGALYAALPPAEARRILRKLEFHYTPKHASWLNMVEIEIGTMNRQCLDRRIPDHKTLTAELQAWEHERNQEAATIDWMFDVDAARRKLARAYPLNQSESQR
ncbi:MAG TPA: IS630 family transposase [Planctomycetaceae bacterium]|nr:IS630 family transposase [Planctomycetaceae bacterium]